MVRLGRCAAAVAALRHCSIRHTDPKFLPYHCRLAKLKKDVAQSLAKMRSSSGSLAAAAANKA